MAGNSVPLWFNVKGIIKKPPGLDITWCTDNSISMGRYAAFIRNPNNFKNLETALREEGIGIRTENRYSMCRAGEKKDFGNNKSDLNPVLAEMEKQQFRVTVSGKNQRWATGLDYLNDRVVNSQIQGDEMNFHENLGLGMNCLTDLDRDYRDDGVERINIMAGDEQMYQGARPGYCSKCSTRHVTEFTKNPKYAARYIGVVDVDFQLKEPCSPNPRPKGRLSGYVYTTDDKGVAIYYDSGNINYREDVQTAKFTAKADGGTYQDYVDHAKRTNGAIFDVDDDFGLMSTALGKVLGKYLYTTQSFGGGG